MKYAKLPQGDSCDFLTLARKKFRDVKSSVVALIRRERRLLGEVEPIADLARC